MRKILIYILLLTLSIVLHTFGKNQADSLDRHFLGIAGGLNHVWNDTQIPLIPGSDDCGVFNKGDDNSFYIGIVYDYMLLNNLLYVSPRVLYDVRPVTLTGSQSGFEILDPVSNQYVQFVRKFTYEGSLKYLDVDIGLKVKPLAEIPVLFRMGIDAGNAVFGKDYANYEEIVSPEGVLFPDDTKKRTVEKGELLSSGTSLGLNLSLHGSFKLDAGYFINPEIMWRRSLNSALSNVKWDTDILRLGVSIAWSFGAKSKPVSKDTLIKELPTIVEQPKGIAIIDTIVVPPAKELKPVLVSNPVQIRETIVTQTYPLLPYIFFDSASSDIGSRYKRDIPAAEFSEEKLLKETLDIYYSILDIIGNRMSLQPGARLNINGVTDGSELNEINARTELAKKRAEEISNYLENKWGINKNRLIISAEDQPKLPTSISYAEGYEENRRVELSSNDPKILAPVIHSRFAEYDIISDSLIFSLSPGDEIKTAAINLSLASDENNVLTTQSFPSPDYLVVKLNPTLMGGFSSMLKSNKEIIANIEFIQENKDFHASSPVKFEKTTNQFEIGRLNLIVFDFDKYEISKSNQLMLREFVTNSIHATSDVDISGSTDRLGETAYNKTLSLDRAKAVEAFINKIRPESRIVSVKGLGATNLQYSNDSPEGRFYCRTVLIQVKTPLKNDK